MHSIHKMQPIATDGVVWSACLLVTFGGMTWVGQRIHVLDGGHDCLGRAILGLSSAVALYAAQNQRQQWDCSRRLQCSRLVDVTLHCLPVKNPPPCDVDFCQIL